MNELGLKLEHTERLKLRSGKMPVCPHPEGKWVRYSGFKILQDKVKELELKLKHVACESYHEGLKDAEFMGDYNWLWGKSISYHTHFKGLPLDTYKDK